MPMYRQFCIGEVVYYDLGSSFIPGVIMSHNPDESYVFKPSLNGYDDLNLNVHSMALYPWNRGSHNLLRGKGKHHIRPMNGNLELPPVHP